MRSKLLYMVITLLILAFAGYLVQVAFVGDPLENLPKVSDLRLNQEGTEIAANWSSMDCDGYTVSYYIDGRRQTVMDVRDNTYIIRGVQPGQFCQVRVNARLKNGLPSLGAKASIRADKVSQNIGIDETVYYGFAGNDFRLNVSADGDLKYRSSDKRIATVDRRGKVMMEDEGEAEITISAEGNGFFSDGERTVSVIVYPAVLDKIHGAATENLSPSRALIRWDLDEYATAYKVLRKNPATEEYEELTRTTDDVNYLEVTRNDYDYSVKGIAEVNGEGVDGRMSDTIEVRGTTQEAKAYKKVKIIKKLRSKDLETVAEIHGADGARTPQSLSMIGDRYVVTYVNMDNTKGYLISYNKKDGSIEQTVNLKGINHGNGSAYNPYTNRLYVLAGKVGEKSRKCFVFDGETLKLLQKITLPVEASSIAYDLSNDKFYLSKQEMMHVCSSSFKIEKTMKKTVRYQRTQDIGAYNGAFLVGTWPDTDESYIDIYRISDGAYLGSYDVSIGEIESCVVDDGYLVLLMNTVGSTDDRIYRTKKRIAIP